MARQVVAEFDAVTGPFLRKLNQIDASVGRFEQRAVTGFARIENSMNRMVSASARLSTFSNAIAAGLGARELTRFIDSSKRIRNALREAGDTSEETYDMVYKSSVRALAGFEATAQGVLRFQKALDGRQGLEQTNRDLETLNKLLALSGKTAQERSSTMIQFSQALQAGYLGGEELRAIRENAPIDLVRAIAREAGGSISDLKDLAAEYKLTTEVMITALQSLEEEADRRFSEVYVTFQDAATVLQSGAIRAIEGLDAGLGFSESIIIAMKEIGELLGENAGLAENFGQALQIALGVATAKYASGALGGALQSILAVGPNRRAAAAAAEAEFAAARRELAIAEERARVASRTTDALILQGAAQAKVEKATAAQTAAIRKLTEAQATAARAARAATVAQEMLLLRTRALTAAGTLLSSAWNFLGGWTGLLVGVGLAMYMLYSRTESFADRIDRLTTDEGRLQDATEKVTLAYDEYRKAVEDAGTETGSTSNKILEAAKKNLEGANQQLKAAKATEQLEQAERIRARAEVDERIKLLEAQREAELKAVNTRSIFPGQGKRTDDQRLQEQLSIERRYDDLIKAERDNARRLDTAIREAYQWISDARALFTKLPDDDVDAGPTADQIKAWEEAEKAAQRFVQSQETEFERLQRTYLEMASVKDVLLQKYKEEDPAIQAVNRAMDRLQVEMGAASNEGRRLIAVAQRLKAVLSALGSFSADLQGRMAIAQRQIDAIAEGASETRVDALAEAGQILNSMNNLKVENDGIFGKLLNGAISTAMDVVTQKTEDVIKKEKELTDLREKTFDDDKGGGGGRSRKTPWEDSVEKAAQFVESMMTDEERRAKTVAEMSAIYNTMKDRLGENHEAVKALGVAMERYKEETIDAMRLLNDGLAQAIISGDSFQEILGRIIARLIEMNGVKAFEALFAGEGLGQFFKVLVGAAANGGKVDNGRLTRFATGGIVGSPTYFPLRSGLGLMGEAGPEAIVPLPDGRSIPVKLSVPNLSPEMSVHIHENASEGDHRVVMSNGGQRLDVYLRKAVSDTIESGGADKAMQRRFGVRTAPIGG